jgi:hypothetical protein
VPVPDPETKPTLPLWVGDGSGAAELLGYGSRSTAHRHADDGIFPCRVLRLGARTVVPTSELRRVLGLDTEPAKDGASA